MKQRAAFYRKVAKFCFDGGNKIDPGNNLNGGYHYGGACDVISHETYPFKATWDERQAFQHWFVDTEDYLLMEDVINDPEEAQRVRILALCFMSALIEAGDELPDASQGDAI